MKGSNFLTSVKVSKPGRNKFDLSHSVATSMNMGYLVPTMCLEVLPGDRFSLGAESLTRFQPLVTPVMHRYDVRHEYFFVPFRLLWEKWEDYITQTKTGGVLPGFPYCSALTAYSVAPKLANYLFVPDPNNNPGPLSDRSISAFPFAAYQKICNDYYRNQSLMPDLAEDIKLVNGDCDGIPELFKLRKRCWNADLYTKALPDTQKGDPVKMPVTLDDSPVKQNNTAVGGAPNLLDSVSVTPVYPDAVVGLKFNPDFTTNELYADNSEVQSQTTINDLRLAVRLQTLLEKMMRAGSRYFEFIRSVFGVTSPDSRLQRSEFITAVKSPVMISEVLNTTGTAEAPQGTMAGHGVSGTGGKFGSYYAQEHGFIMCITSVMPRTSYFQGFDKLWLKINNPLDFSVPELTNIGEQPIINDEVYAYQSNGTETFGYLPKDYDLRFQQNRISGELQTSLSTWQHARKFDAQPSLNESFVQADVKYGPFAVTAEDVDHIIMQVLHIVQAIRPIPKFGTPTSF